MSINDITGNKNSYLKSLSMDKHEKEYISSSKDSKLEKSLEFKDSIDISTSIRKLSSANSIGGITIDKGTAAHTTLYVDRSSFDQITNYSTNNEECKWEELGIDDEKRWVVINGQRFECPLSEEEKEARRRLRKGFIEMIIEAEEERDKHKSNFKLEKHSSFTVNLDESNKFKVNCNDDLKSNDKINNLMNNDKVVKMLSDIMKMNGGQGINLAL